MTVGKQRNCGRGIEYEWAGYRSARGAAALLNSRPSLTTLIGLPLTDKPRRKAVLAHVRQQKVWYGHVSCPAMKTRKDLRAVEQFKQMVQTRRREIRPLSKSWTSFKSEINKGGKRDRKTQVRDIGRSDPGLQRLGLCRGRAGGRRRGRRQGSQHGGPARRPRRRIQGHEDHTNAFASCRKLPGRAAGPKFRCSRGQPLQGPGQRRDCRHHGGRQEGVVAAGDATGACRPQGTRHGRRSKGRDGGTGDVEAVDVASAARAVRAARGDSNWRVGRRLELG